MQDVCRNLINYPISDRLAIVGYTYIDFFQHLNFPEQIGIYSARDRCDIGLNTAKKTTPLEIFLLKKIDNKLKLIKRKAYGFRKFDDLRLKSFLT